MTNRKAIVTGSASGIGAATVLALAEQGYDTVGIDCNLPGAEASALKARAAGGEHHALLCDVANEAQLVKVMAQAAALLGGLDALATCAGVTESSAFMDLSAKEFQSVYGINVIGTFVAIREAAKTCKQVAASAPLPAWQACAVAGWWAQPPTRPAKARCWP